MSTITGYNSSPTIVLLVTPERYAITAGMRRMWSVATTLMVLMVAVSAHPHPVHPGECSELGALRSGRHLWGGESAQCVGGVRPPKILHDAFKSCGVKVRHSLLGATKRPKPPTLDADQPELQEAMKEMLAICVVERLELEEDDGSLDKEALLQAASKMEGKDFEKVAYMQDAVRECARNSTGTEAAKQLVEVMSCVQEAGERLCLERSALVTFWLTSDGEPGVCNTVQIDSEIQQTFRSCFQAVTDHSLHEVVMSEETGMLMAVRDHPWIRHSSREPLLHERKRRHPHPRRKNQQAAEVWEAVLCTERRLGWYTDEDGFDFLSMSESVANFTGWEDLSEELGNLTEAIVDCAPEFEGDPVSQAIRWASCFRPRYMEICGLRNNLTMFFFPTLRHQVGEALRDAVRDVIDMHDHDHDDDGDEEEDENEYINIDVDDGLLEPLFMTSEIESDAMFFTQDDDDAEDMDGGDDAEAMLSQLKKGEDKHSSSSSSEKSEEKLKEKKPKEEPKEKSGESGEEALDEVTEASTEADPTTEDAAEDGM